MKKWSKIYQNHFKIIVLPVRAVAEACDQKIRIRAWTLSEACWKPSVCLTRASPNKENSKKVTENGENPTLLWCKWTWLWKCRKIIYPDRNSSPVVQVEDTNSKAGWIQTDRTQPALQNHYCSRKKQSRTETRFAKLHVVIAPFWTRVGMLPSGWLYHFHKDNEEVGKCIHTFIIFVIQWKWRKWWWNGLKSLTEC